jgi:hypothetical protein
MNYVKNLVGIRWLLLIACLLLTGIARADDLPSWNGRKLASRPASSPTRKRRSACRHAWWSTSG